jgi:hypothetical protein
MLKFSVTLPIILSSIHISFSQAQGYLPSCAVSCAQIAAYQAGCNPCVPSIRITYAASFHILSYPHVAEMIRLVSVPTTRSSELRLLACGRAVATRMLKRRQTIGPQCAAATGRHPEQVNHHLTYTHPLLTTRNRKYNHGDPFKLCPTLLLARVSVQLIRN